MDVLRGGHFAVKYADGERGAAGEAELALRALERIRDRIGREFSWFPSKPVAVVLYSGEEFREVTGAHGWMGGLFDGKIRIPLRGMRLDDGMERLLTHEYAHALVAERAGGAAPGWLDEGFAQWVAGEWSPARAEAMTARIAGGPLLSFESLQGSFTKIRDPQVAETAYFQAYLAVDYLIDRYGSGDFQRVLDRIAREEPPVEALQEVCALTYERLAEEVAEHREARFARR
jgi:hypothetical protein